MVIILSEGGTISVSKNEYDTSEHFSDFSLIA